MFLVLYAEYCLQFWGARRGMYAWPLSGYCDTRYSQPGYLIDLIEMKKRSYCSLWLFHLHGYLLSVVHL